MIHQEHFGELGDFYLVMGGFIEEQLTSIKIGQPYRTRQRQVTSQLTQENIELRLSQTRDLLNRTNLPDYGYLEDEMLSYYDRVKYLVGLTDKITSKKQEEQQEWPVEMVELRETFRHKGDYFWEKVPLPP